MSDGRLGQHTARNKFTRLTFRVPHGLQPELSIEITTCLNIHSIKLTPSFSAFLIKYVYMAGAKEESTIGHHPYAGLKEEVSGRSWVQ